MLSYVEVNTETVYVVLGSKSDRVSALFVVLLVLAVVWLLPSLVIVTMYETLTCEHVSVLVMISSHSISTLVAVGLDLMLLGWAVE